MSGSVYDVEYGLGGPSDDGVGVKVWQAFQGLDAAREAHVAASGRRTLLEALLAPLTGVEGGGA